MYDAITMIHVHMYDAIIIIIHAFMHNGGGGHGGLYMDVLVIWPRSRGAKDKVKQARRAAYYKLRHGGP